MAADEFRSINFSLSSVHLSDYLLKLPKCGAVATPDDSKLCWIAFALHKEIHLWFDLHYNRPLSLGDSEWLL